MKTLITFLTTALIMLFINPAYVQAQQTLNSKPIVAQYFGIWVEKGQTWEQKFRIDTPFAKLNRLYIAFGKIIKVAGDHFSIEFDGDNRHAQAIIDRMRAVNPTAEIFISLGGDGSSNQFGGAAKDQKFAENVLNFLAKYGLNGLDIDWEIDLDKANLNLLVTRLYTSLHNAGYKLTLATWPSPLHAYDMQVLKDNLDQINIMSYGKAISLKNCAEQYIKKGFPANKLIGGIETEIPYYQFGGTDSLGPTGTIAQKTKYALTHGLAGMMSWRLDNDYPQENDLRYPTYKGAHALWEMMMLSG